MESENSSFIDYTIDYQQLKQLFEKYNITSKGQSKKTFDRFYNDYTKVYPLSGGLSKTAHLKGVLKPGEEKTIDGIQEVMKFLDNPDKEVRFLDVTFCKGGCIGGPCLSSKNIKKNKEKVMQYFKIAEKEKIPLGKEGLVEKAKGIKFIY